MTGIKAEVEKELRSLGVRKFDKQGRGTVSIKQGKTSELIALLTKIKKNKYELN